MSNDTTGTMLGNRHYDVVQLIDDQWDALDARVCGLIGDRLFRATYDRLLIQPASGMLVARALHDREAGDGW